MRNLTTSDSESLIILNSEDTTVSCSLQPHSAPPDYLSSKYEVPRISGIQAIQTGNNGSPYVKLAYGGTGDEPSVYYPFLNPLSHGDLHSYDSAAVFRSDQPQDPPSSNSPLHERVVGLGDEVNKLESNLWQLCSQEYYDDGISSYGYQQAAG
eukprot:6214726-Pleurochrysis_carterae.AAC.1